MSDINKMKAMTKDFENLLNEDGCRVWETDGKKYMCFWDTALERYTTCINPKITYKRKVS